MAKSGGHTIVKDFDGKTLRIYTVSRVEPHLGVPEEVKGNC